MSARLLRAQLRGTDYYEPGNVPLILHWSDYSAKAIALIRARGMPIDMAKWNAVQENIGAVIPELIQRFDPSYGNPFPINWWKASGVTRALRDGSSLSLSTT